jgi:predicted alpha/beta hydrolase family esterase/DNA-binding MarR family transcriptional regulator
VLFDTWLTARAAIALLNSVLAGTGLDAKDFAVYSVLRQAGEISPGELARWMSAPATTVSSHVKRLVARGHVQQVPHPGDRRSYYLTLTDSGRHAHGEAGRQFVSALTMVEPALAQPAGDVQQALRDLRAAIDAAASRTFMADHANRGRTQPDVYSRCREARVRMLMVPGIGGSDERHWQSLWQMELDAPGDRIEPASWDAPDLDDWLAAVSRKVGPATVLVAHSLGCLAATMWLLQRGPSTVVGAFLVSPPDPDGPAFPAQARSFSAPRGKLPVPAVVVASSDDPFADISVARRFAHDWGADFVDAGPAGHINSSSGVGAWEAGRAQLRTFIRSLPSGT